MASQNLQVQIESKGSLSIISLSGELTILQLGDIEKSLKSLLKEAGGEVSLDLCKVTKLDTAGNALLCKTLKTLKAKGIKYKVEQGEKGVGFDFDSCPHFQPPKSQTNPPFYLAVPLSLGEFVVQKSKQIYQMIGFFGWVLVLFGKSIIRPWSLRWTPLVAHMDQVGLRAVPIIGLLTFLIGLVIMYMGAKQLVELGAGELSINLLEVAIFRELGPMLTAIVVAGRSGSAFTAQIGAMVSNEELSAMRVMGFEPMEFLVLPRVLALVIMLPVLTIVSDFAGLLGGAVGAWMILDMDFGSFINQFHQVANVNNYFTGLVKAPFFAMCIAVIGCFHGMRAKGSAASVGALTTQSVVESIFVVITLDAIFALAYSALGI